MLDPPALKNSPCQLSTGIQNWCWSEQGKLCQYTRRVLLVGYLRARSSSRTGKVRAIQNREDWCLWASYAAIETREVDGGIGDGDGLATMDSIHCAIVESGAQASISGGTGDDAEAES
jgi:hypothetical protein